MSALPVIVAGLLCVASMGFAQETSVKPGINDSFQDPDVGFYVNLFEGESRAIFKYRNEIIDVLQLEEGTDVADIGAGTGFFSRMMAHKVGPRGTVYAVDIAENFIEHIAELSKKEGLKNMKAIVCSERSVDLPENSIDVAFICDVYHHFEYPYDSMASLHKAMRPGGRLVIVDFERVKGVSREWTLGHVRCGKGTVTDEVKDSGFEFVEEVDLGMNEQWVRVYRKRG
ncbi:MAG: class I SAM-dependent methyltransferase, partial [Candidatus Hydrogenedentes bacterium]|nr:class I SAM-dependent methyltransferase [Candidatus Hydrogenedentota bacterium]